jgi:pyrroloquinoline quinone biosynthesis protein E
MSERSRRHAELLRAPLQATWAITSRCDLDCEYCLEDPRPAAEPEPVPEAERRAILHELVASRVLKVYLSGGEPLLIEALPEYVARLRQGGAAVHLTTNGTLADDEAVARLARAGLGVAEVSIHPGSEGAAACAIERFVRRGVKTVARLVVTAASISRALDVVRPFTWTGADTIALQEVAPMGRAARARERMAPSAEGLARLAEEVAHFNAGRGAGPHLTFASTTLGDRELGHPAPCSLEHALRKSCEIRPTGDVLPCSPAVAYGVENSIHEKGLAACFRDLPGLFGPFAAEPPGGDCSLCAHVAACRGGCRAVAFAIAGRNDAGNPVCSFFERGAAPGCAGGPSRAFPGETQ